MFVSAFQFFFVRGLQVFKHQRERRGSEIWTGVRETKEQLRKAEKRVTKKKKKEKHPCRKAQSSPIAGFSFTACLPLLHFVLMQTLPYPRVENQRGALVQFPAAAWVSSLKKVWPLLLRSKSTRGAFYPDSCFHFCSKKKRLWVLVYSS